MKPKNFPMRKLIRKLNAKKISLYTEESKKALNSARSIRTKKDRSGSSK